MKVPAPPAAPGALPVVGHAAAFLRDPVGLLQRGHRARGDVFSLRFGRRRAVVLLGPEHHEFFFKETDRRLSIRTAYPFFLRMFDEQFYFFAGPEGYHRQRSLVAPRFQGRQLDGYVKVMAAETDELMKVMGERGELDLIPTLGPLVMRIAARAFLGEDFSSRLGARFFDEFRRFSAGMDPVTPLWLPLPHLVRSRRARAWLHRRLGEVIAARRRQPVSPPDFLQSLVEARFPDGGGAVPDLVLINLILLLAWAGHETTTGHISWALIDLLQHPEELAAVRAEQDSVLEDGDGDGLPLDDLRRLRRMDWALHETERLHPVAFMLMRTALEPLDHAGWHIDKDTMILVSPAVAHRSPFEFAAPDRYRPERFDTEGTGRELIGFGGGLHRCLGVHFAYLEMKVVLTLLLRRYDFELLDPDPQPVPGAKTKWPQSPCRVRYRRRGAGVPVTPLAYTRTYVR